MAALVAGGNFCHGIDYVHAFDDLAENCVAPALLRLSGKIKKSIVSVIDEKL